MRTNEIGVQEFAPMSPQQLIDFLRRHRRPQGLTAAFGGMIGLVDGTIHHQDIRRALRRPREVPIERLERILPLVPGNPRLGAGRRIRGIRLIATDLDWQHGNGPEASGTAEALLLAMTGCQETVGERSGPGQATLAARVAR